MPKTGPKTERLSLSASIRVQVEFYVNENTFKERLKLFFIKNQRSSKWAVKSHTERTCQVDAK